MIILAIETATSVSGVAVSDGTKILSEITGGARLTHSETLQPHIKLALDIAGVARDDVNGVAVSIGPGSFTGLRIGLAAAKSLAYAWGVPIVGVPTLAALAANLPARGVRLLPLLDAQKGNAYSAEYEWIDGELMEINPPRVMNFEEIIETAENSPIPVILLGEFAAKKMSPDSVPKNAKLAPLTHIYSRASSVAMIGAGMIARGETENVMNMEPFYIRRSEAEVLWEARHS